MPRGGEGSGVEWGRSTHGNFAILLIFHCVEGKGFSIMDRQYCRPWLDFLIRQQKAHLRFVSCPKETTDLCQDPNPYHSLTFNDRLASYWTTEASCFNWWGWRWERGGGGRGPLEHGRDGLSCWTTWIKDINLFTVISDVELVFVVITVT